MRGRIGITERKEARVKLRMIVKAKILAQIDITKKSSASLSPHKHRDRRISAYLQPFLHRSLSLTSDRQVAEWLAKNLVEVRPRRYRRLQRRHRHPSPRLPRNLQSYGHASHRRNSSFRCSPPSFKASKASIFGSMTPLPVGCAAGTRSRQKLP